MSPFQIAGSGRVLSKAIGTALITLGLILIALSAGYYGYARMAEARLGWLVKSLDVSDGSPQHVPPSSYSDVSQNAPKEQVVRESPSLASGQAPQPEGASSQEGEGRVISASLSESPQKPSVKEPAAGKRSSPVVGPFLKTFPPYLRPELATRIIIPSIEVDSRVVELGTTYDEKGELVWDTPKHAVGHLKGTANPGEVGNVAMAGHINSPTRGEGNVFRRLPEVQPGDEVTLYTFGARFNYVVTETKVVLPEEISVIFPTPEPILTLITCVPDWVWSHRLIVVARPVAVEPLAP